MRPLNPPPACAVVTRRRVQMLGGVTIPAVVLASVLSANPAFAAPVDKSAVTSAFGSANATMSTLHLTGNLTGDAGTADVQTLADGAKLTIDLDGHDLDLDRIVLGAGSELIVEDLSTAPDKGVLSVGGASFTTDDEVSGIKLNRNAELTVDGAEVIASGSGAQPGIGTTGATTGTRISLDHAHVTATSGTGAALRAETVGLVASEVSATGVDATSTTVDEDSTLAIPTSSSLKVATGQTLTNDGTVRGSLTGTGTVANGGTILPGTNGSVGTGLTVTGHSYAVTFNRNGLSGGSAADQQVYAEDLATAGVTDITSSAPSSSTANFVRWEAGGAEFTPTTDLEALATSGSNGKAVAVTAKTSLKVVPSAAVLSDGIQDVAYTGTVAAASGQDIVSYAAAGLPAGITLNTTTGALTGAPTEHGTFTVHVTITTTYDGTHTADYPLTVGTLPVLSTAALADGAMGTAYTGAITATDSDPTTHFSFVRIGTLPPGLTLNPDGTITGSPTAKGSYTFDVKAIGTWGSSTRSYTIVTHSIPVFSTTNLVAPVGNAFSGKVTATNSADDGAITYEIANRGTLPTSFTLDPDGTLHGPATRTNEYRFTVVAHNTWKDVQQEVVLSVGAVPQFTTDASLPDASKGVAYRFGGSAVKIAASGVGVSYTATNLPNGLSIDPTTGVISGAPTQTADGDARTFTVTASNRFGQVDQDFTIKIGTAPTIIGPVALLDGSTARDYSTTIATGGTGDRTVTVSGLPAGLTYSATNGTISGRPLAAGPYSVVVTVTSHWGTATTTLPLHVGTVPTVLATTLDAPVLHEDYDVQVSATGADSFSSTDLPSWLTLDPQTGDLSGTPDESGAVTFTVVAHNDYGDTSKTYTVTVGAAPAVSHTALPHTAVVGKAFSFTPAVTGDAVTVSVDQSTLPDGLTFTNGVISGTPTAAGTTTVTVHAHSVYGDSSWAYDIVVKAPISVTTDQLAPVTLVQDGTDLSADVVLPIELAGEGADQQLELLSGPDWLEVDGLSLTGTATEPGDYTVKVKATSDLDGDVAVKTFHLLVGLKPDVVRTVLAQAVVGDAYTAQLQLADAGDTPDTTTTWSATGLPAGLRIDSASGAISGTPTAAGSSDVVVTARTAFGTSAARTLALAVKAKAVTPAPVETTAPKPADTAAPTPAPVKTTPAPAPATAPVLPTVPPLTSKFGYSMGVAVAADSRTVVTYSIADGSLPKGVVLNSTSGVISGAPAEEGVFRATVRATNAAGSATTVVTITVPKVVELVKATPSALTPKVGQPVQVTVKGLAKGEAWTVKVDGKTKMRGVAKKTGDLVVAVPLPKSLRDKAHTIRVSGHKSVTDPAKRDWTTVTVTSVSARKSLSVTRAGDVTTVKRLAPGESVVITDSGRTLAKGTADAKGVFTFTGKLAKGKHTLKATGSTAKRSGTLSVKIG